MVLKPAPNEEFGGINGTMEVEIEDSGGPSTITFDWGDMVLMTWRI